MATADDVLRIARAELGTTSGAKYWRLVFPGIPYIDGDATPYCACFVSWVLNQAGVSCPTFPRGLAIDQRDAFGDRMVDRDDLRPGDPVGFDWSGRQSSGDHVGIFESWINRGYSFYCLEGNTSGGIVARRVRYVSQVTCGVRPYYSSSPAPTPSRLDVDGWAGPATISAWQRALGTTVDGVISGQYRPNWDHFDHITAVDFDGGSGDSQLVRAVQKKIGASVDGVLGPESVKKLQEWLTSKGYKTNVDGYAGTQTICNLQRSINDGKWK